MPFAGILGQTVLVAGLRPNETVTKSAWRQAVSKPVAETRVSNKTEAHCHLRPIYCWAGLPPEAHPPATQGPSTCHPRPVQLQRQACYPRQACLLKRPSLAMGSTSISKSPAWVPELPTFVHGWLSKYCCSEGM